MVRSNIREIRNCGETCTQAKQGHAHIKDVSIYHNAADYDNDKPKQSSCVAKLRNAALGNASFENTRDQDRDQNERPPNGCDARGLSHGHAKGFRAEGFEEDSLPKDGCQKQQQIDEEHARNGIRSDGVMAEVICLIV